MYDHLQCQGVDLKLLVSISDKENDTKSARLIQPELDKELDNNPKNGEYEFDVENGVNSVLEEDLDINDEKRIELSLLETNKSKKDSNGNFEQSNNDSGSTSEPVEIQSKKDQSIRLHDTNKTISNLNDLFDFCEILMTKDPTNTKKVIAAESKFIQFWHWQNSHWSEQKIPVWFIFILTLHVQTTISA